jgi:N6-adenosine-specific RNA methylase IME4
MPSHFPARSADLAALVSAGCKFGTIYADPPWRYEKTVGRAACSKHYDTMSIPELCAMPVRELATNDAHLHLWVTNAFLFESHKLLDAWGFNFEGTLLWAKPTMGCGNYFRNAHELMLVATRNGSPIELETGHVHCRRGRHSAKPEQVRRIIERASPGPRLELFGRREAPGWTVFGNQIEDTLFGHQAA